MASCLKMMKRNKKEADINFMNNGRMLLEELIASCDGKCNPIRTFSAKELQQATNNYDPRHQICEDGSYTRYKGFLEDHPISVKMFKFISVSVKICEDGSYMFYYKGFREDHPISVKMITSSPYELPFTDIAVGSQMSVHKNVLKLIGCCLETRNPILVYEYGGCKTLSQYLYDGEGHREMQPLSWRCRIKMAVDIANAIAYLHSALPRPIVNRDIRPSNIILDENYVAKLMDFSLSIVIPEGESYVQFNCITGTLGFSDPAYLLTGQFSEKSDVYSFGMVLISLFTGQANLYSYTNEYADETDYDPIKNLRNHIEQNGIEKALDPGIVAEGPWTGKEQQLNAFMALAFRCIHESAEDRPTMTEVGKELGRIYQSMISP